MCFDSKTVGRIFIKFYMKVMPLVSQQPYSVVLVNRDLEEIRIARVTTSLARIYDSATAMCAKTLIIYISVTAPAPSVPAADVFGTVLLH